MPSSWSLSLPLVCVIVCLLAFAPQAYAFGAGNIPAYSFLEGKAFRHGDIEDVLADLIKKSSGFLGRGSKFSGLDIKRVYFGNWLRDYSQAMDVAGLTKLSKQTIINLIMALGFMAHGYATGEFEVTEERLGVYSCLEHIDNPKGYGADQPGGDARHVDPRLRGPVDPRELEVDPRTGMKNYIANESGGWGTSTALVRDLIRKCIDMGRKARNGSGEAATYEAYRLLGTLLHTLEDFSAHSNWCELSLLRLGHRDVFCHVGDAVRIQTPAGPAPPLVTGTFGGSDFIHSLLSEGTDHISEASVSDLSKAMDGAKTRSMDGSNSSSTLAKLLFDLPGSTGSDLSREMQGVEDIRTRAQNGQMNEMSPQELHAVLWKVLTFRDNVVKGIETTIEKIPGLSSLVEKLTNSVNAFVFTTIEPLLKPIMGQATQVLTQGTAAVIDNEDQYEVFNNPHASDPTHSFLSKDHFALILNEPAGQIAIIVLRHAVRLIVKAWDDNSMNPDFVASDILAALHHPFFYDDQSSVQREMGAYLKSWIDGQTPEDKRYILNALTKDSVRNHKNRRKGHLADQIGHGHGSQWNSVLLPNGVGAFAQQHIPGASSVMSGVNQVQSTFNSFSSSGGGGGHGGRRDVDQFQPPPAGFMPPPGGPPQAVHGGAPDFNEFSSSNQSGYPGSHHGHSASGGMPQPQHLGGGSSYEGGGHHGPSGHACSQQPPSFGGPHGGYGGGGGYGGQDGGYGGAGVGHPGGFGGPPPPPPSSGPHGQPHYGGGGPGGYGAPPGGYGGPQGGYGGQQGGGYGGQGGYY
ncbi:hypothetical protein JCM10212_002703 [Sporobolomyces blumeae]